MKIHVVKKGCDDIMNTLFSHELSNHTRVTNKGISTRLDEKIEKECKKIILKEAR